MKNVWRIAFCLILVSNGINCKKPNESPKPLPTSPGHSNDSKPGSPDGKKPGSAHTTSQNSPTQLGDDHRAGTDQEEVELGPKLNHYVDCINSFSKRIYDSSDRYNKWCTKACQKNGPTGKETYITYGLYQMSDPAQCIKKIAEANAMAPSLPALEKPANDYAQALKSLYPVVKEAYEYYEQKNYQDDQGAKGREFHPKLMAGWENFEKADQALKSQLEVLTDELNAKELKVLEKELGRTLPFLVKNIMVQAKALLRVGKVEKLADLKLDAFSQKLTEYEKAVNEFNEYVDFSKHPDHKAEADKVTLLSLFESSAKDYLKSSKALMRRVRDKVPFSTGDKMMLEHGLTEGSVENLLKTYNELVDHSNSLTFRD